MAEFVSVGQILTENFDKWFGVEASELEQEKKEIMENDNEFVDVYDSDAIDAAFDALETVAQESAVAVTKHFRNPQDEAMITTIGMVLAYKRSRAWLRNMERLGRQNGHSEMADLIAEGMPEWDSEIDTQCMFGDTL